MLMLMLTPFISLTCVTILHYCRTALRFTHRNLTFEDGPYFVSNTQLIIDLFYFQESQKRLDGFEDIVRQ